MSIWDPSHGAGGGVAGPGAYIVAVDICIHMQMHKYSFIELIYYIQYRCNILYTV